MDKIIDSINYDTCKNLKELEDSFEASIKTLSDSGNKLRSFLILYMLVSKSKDALEQIKDALPDIEKRLQEDVDGVCKLAREVLDGAETRAKWIKDIIDALGKLCGNTDLSMRESELHNQMEDMETALKSLIEKRAAIPLDQLDKEK